MVGAGLVASAYSSVPGALAALNPRVRFKYIFKITNIIVNTFIDFYCFFLISFYLEWIIKRRSSSFNPIAVA
jgi:hypothetical protein